MTTTNGHDQNGHDQNGHLKNGKARKPGVLLLSGGLDSSTVLAMAKADGFDVHCLAFRYGQRHGVELEHAQNVARAGGAASFRVLNVDLRAFGGSALTSELTVPKHRDVEAIGKDDVPITYVPARNTLFLSYALAFAEVLGAHDLFIGANAVDFSGYPDCRPEFIEAFTKLANVATRMGMEGTPIHVHAPLLHMKKAEIIATGTRLGVDYGLTWSCYDPQGDGACGACDSCILRRKGFEDAGVEDPTIYASSSESTTSGA
jgi:7-cyano-7-deazaguanine synthase